MKIAAPNAHGDRNSPHKDFLTKKRLGIIDVIRHVDPGFLIIVILGMHQYRKTVVKHFYPPF